MSGIGTGIASRRVGGSNGVNPIYAVGDLLDESPHGVTCREVAEYLLVSTSTARRLLGHLVSIGAAEKKGTRTLRRRQSLPEGR